MKRLSLPKMDDKELLVFVQESHPLNKARHQVRSGHARVEQAQAQARPPSIYERHRTDLEIARRVIMSFLETCAQQDQKLVREHEVGEGTINILGVELTAHSGKMMALTIETDHANLVAVGLDASSHMVSVPEIRIYQNQELGAAVRLPGLAGWKVWSAQADGTAVRVTLIESTSIDVRTSIAPPADAGERYQAGWKRADAIAVAGGDLNQDGPARADEETWTGFIDALAAHRRAAAENTL